MLELNSYVIYGDNGVCLVADKRKEKFAGVIREYYILKPQGNEGSTLFVPTVNEELLSKMRSILTKDEILDIIHSLPGEEVTWEDNNKVRGEYYSEVFEKGDRRELLLLIKALYEHKVERKEEGKKLWTIDENAMKHAENLVYEEFGTVLGIPQEEVIDFIMEEVGKVERGEV
ncbi:MAG: CarD family transcriptional regulator [Clostridia bacterium]|nr:CarD family transcriptional regulator [Clostridia bacterium]